MTEKVVLKEGWSVISEAVHQGGLSSGWSFIRVVSSGWHFIRVVLNQGSLSSERSGFNQGCLYSKGRSSWKSFMRMDFHQDGLSSGRSLIREIFIQKGRSSRKSLIRISLPLDERQPV